MNTNRLLLTLIISISACFCSLNAIAMDIDEAYLLRVQASNADGSALRDLQKNAEAGDSAAESQLSMIYLWGEGLAQDDSKAIYWLRKASKQGDVHAKINLNLIYYTGSDSISCPDDEDEKSISLIKNKANHKNAWAQNCLGLMYKYGQGVTRNDEQSVAWFKKAAEQKYAPAQYNLGMMYEKGRGVPQSYDNAASLMAKSAYLGDTHAQKRLGGPPLQSQYVHNPQSSIWYIKAAEQGYSEAQADIGINFDAGYDVPQDYIQSLYWLRKAAEQGSAIGQENLAMMYQNGHGVPVNHIVAFSLYSMSLDGLSIMQPHWVWDKYSVPMSKQEINESMALIQNMRSIGVIEAIDEYLK